MKRKSIILLSSILAGSLLVGGAFAAYAVTDNADPFGFVATPGTYEEEGTTYVTMEFGNTSTLANIENLEAGQNRKAGIVSLKSTSKYTGDFTVKLVDRTTEREEGAKKLIDYITVGVYEGDPAPAAAGQLPAVEALQGKVGYGAGEGKKTQSTFELTGLPAGKEYAVYLSLTEDVGVYYSQMSNDKVYVEVDWAPKSGDLSVSYPVYFERPAAWAGESPKAFAYAWTDTPSHKENGTFPGVEMTHLRGNIYTLAIPNGLDNLVFSANDGNDEHKTGDITLTGYNANTANYWNGSWGQLPPEQVVASSYKVAIGEAAAVAMTEKTDTDKTDGRITEFMLLNQTVEAGDTLTFKADDADIGATYLTYTGNFDAQNKIQVAGTVDIYLKIYEGTGEGTGHLFYTIWVSTPEVEAGFLFTNSKGWNNIKLYAWTGEGTGKTENAEWPGVAVVYAGQNDFGEDQYTLNWGSFENIIINGDGGQTVDIAVSSLANKSGIYLTGNVDGEGHYEVGTY